MNYVTNSLLAHQPDVKGEFNRALQELTLVIYYESKIQHFSERFSYGFFLN